MKITNEQLQISASAIRGEARIRGIIIKNRNDAFAVWDELARTKRKTVASIVYYEATSKQIERVLKIV